MLQRLHRLADDFRQWSESCICHGWLMSDRDGIRSAEASAHLWYRELAGLGRRCKPGTKTLSASTAH